MRSSSSSSRSLWRFSTTCSSRSAGNLQAPVLVHVHDLARGHVHCRPRGRGTFTAYTSWPPWPGVIPLSRYWNFMGRISSMSRDGPLEMAPTQPRAFMAVVMLPPERPILPASSGGNFC